MSKQALNYHRPIAVGAIAVLSLLIMPSLALTESSIPDVDDKPERTEPTRRDDCILGTKSLTGLIPVTARKLGLTVSPSPTFFFYVPQTGSQVQETDFILLTESGNTLYQTRVKVPSTPGVISLKIPNSAKLQVGKDYRWTFSIICNSRQRTEDVYVNGVVQRVKQSPELIAKLQGAKPREIPSIYAEAGIWHETMSTLAQLRRDNPQDRTLADYWARILGSVGLANLAEEPLVE
ncbi:MAG: DUF928 domain-containing protein [Hormoscilla sp.]